MSESEKLKERISSEKDPAEKAHLRSELDQVPLTSGELDQVKEREVRRKEADIKAYRRARKQ
jgi:hypothetical protein